MLSYGGITPQGCSLFMSNPETSNPSMSDPNASNPNTPEPTPANEPAESFKDIFSEYEQSHSRKREPGAQGREGTVIAVTADSDPLDHTGDFLGRGSAFRHWGVHRGFIFPRTVCFA